jgi:hypothetical protein
MGSRKSNPICRNCRHDFAKNHIWCMGDIICNQCDCVYKPSWPDNPVYKAIDFKIETDELVDRFVWSKPA